MATRQPPGLSSQQEAERIYRAVFHESVPPTLLRRFAEASARLDLRTAAGELDRYHAVLRRVADLESLEVACRFTGTLPTLSTRFRVMVHLAETLPENQKYFLNRRKSRVRAWSALLAGGVVTGLRLLKGLFLLRSHRDA